jgi:hypothetical protein
MTEYLGPLLLAPAQYLEVRLRIRHALGFPHERRPILIGVDGFDGSGKSSLAAWLSWQLEMPAIHLDLYITRYSNPVAFRSDHLATAINARIQHGRPVIVEGILLLDALASVQRQPGFLVYVEKEAHRSDLVAPRRSIHRAPTAEAASGLRPEMVERRARCEGRPCAFEKRRLADCYLEPGRTARPGLICNTAEPPEFPGGFTSDTKSPGGDC